jgi:hypothetical protein
MTTQINERVRSFRVALVSIGLLIVATNALIYFSLCLPERRMRLKDPEGYAHWIKTLHGAGGVWALSPDVRCLVHCLLATLLIVSVVLVVRLFSWLAKRTARARASRG